MTVATRSDDSALTLRKLRVPGRETSVRLEAALWQNFDEICQHLGWSRHTLAGRIDARRDRALGLTNAVRIFLVEYWRLSATNRDANAMALLTQALVAISQLETPPPTKQH